jgi:hypothetical protein
MRLFIFPRGLTYFPPSDRLGRDIAELIMHPTAARERLSRHIYKTQESHNPLGMLQEALILSTMAESLEKRVRVEGVKTGRITALDLPGQISQALDAGIISHAEAAVLRDYDARCQVSSMLKIALRMNWAQAAGEAPIRFHEELGRRTRVCRAAAVRWTGRPHLRGDPHESSISRSLRHTDGGLRSGARTLAACPECRGLYHLAEQRRDGTRTGYHPLWIEGNGHRAGGGEIRQYWAPSFIGRHRLE